MTTFSQANNHLRAGNPAQAIPLYLQALRTTPDLSRIIAPSITLARKRYLAARQGQKPSVAVCGWELAHNPAGRAYNLAQMYATFADTEIIGAYFPKWGRQIWPPLGNVEISVHSFVAEDQTRFADQALDLVTAHPYDVVHLSKPRMPNILFGLLYKLIWGATVLMDIDDEELAFADAETPIALDDYLQKHGRLPELTSLEGKEWTRLGVGLATAFDGVTVSNPALQKRYGGQIIRHARDEKFFQPSPELSSQSRKKFKVPPDKKVVLFFGTPREHKGLLETARAIAGLGRKDVVFTIVGDFPDPALKQKLQEIKGVETLFLGNQPVQSIPEVTALGDVCVLLQKPSAMVSNFQIPAKLTDALAMGRTVILQDLPPTADVIQSGAVIPVKDETALPRALEQALAQPPSAQPDTKAQDLFLKEFSFAANTPRLRQTLQTARSAPKPLDTLHPLLQHIAPLVPYSSLAGLQTKTKAPDIKQQVTKNAVSIIILTRNAAQHLDNCLNSFIKINTHNPVELIIIDHASTDNTADVVAKHKNKGDIQYIRRDKNYSFSESCNFAVSKAKHPYLLFLNNDIIYTADVLPRAIEHITQDPQTGAVGFRLDDDPASLPKGEIQGVQHTGIEFRWNEKRGYHQPEQIRHPSLKDFLSSLTTYNLQPITYNLQPTTALTAAAMLIRKTDFNALNGFSEEYTYGLEDIDLCLRLERDTKKKCFCMNDMGLQHVEGATRKAWYKTKLEIIDNNHKVFKERWADYIKSNLIQPQKTTLRGYVDRVSDGNIVGWVADTNNYTSRMNVSIFIDGSKAVTSKADKMRQDLKDAGIGDGKYAFYLPVPDKWRDGKEHTIEIKVEGYGAIQGCPVKKLLIAEKPAPAKATEIAKKSIAFSPATDNLQPTTQILFILPQTIDGNNGYQVQLLARMLSSQGAHCTIAVPELSDEQSVTNNNSVFSSNLPSVVSYASLLTTDHWPPTSGPKIIHAWTPREIVREFTQKILAKHPCPLIIHLEDNEEYLTEAAVNRPFHELAALPEPELDKLIPKNRYHPTRGRRFLDQASGLTLIIDTLNRFNTRNVPVQVLAPLVDERLFYPRPLNMALRRTHDIPDDHLVLVYTGNVHAGNKDEVHELYKAVDILNQQGCPTVILRTGLDKKGLGIENWNRQFEKHLGWVKREQIPDILAAADILVQPGEPGPFNDMRIPCKLPEFFAMGRPVVLPKTNLGLKVAYDKKAYVLEKVDADGIAKAVRKIGKYKDINEKIAAKVIDFYNDFSFFENEVSNNPQNIDTYIKTVKTGISLVTSCKNRNKDLLQSIKSWLKHPEINEIVIVDWNSDIPVVDSLKKQNINDSRIQVVRAENEPYWILSHAYNLGFRLTQYDKILKADSDIIIHDDFFIKNKLEEHVFIAGNCARQPKENSHINGFFLVHREALFAVNGFNENLSFYGWDDDDLYLRLQSFGIERSDLAAETITHIEHEDKFRLENARLPVTNSKSGHLENDPDFLIRVNREISNLLPPWWNNCSMSSFRLNSFGPHFLTAERKEHHRQTISNVVLDYAWEYAARELLFDRERIDSTGIGYSDFWDCMAKPTWSESVNAINAHKQNYIANLNSDFTYNSNIVAPPFRTKGKPGISLVTCAMNRFENLLQAIGTWVAHQEISEIIIVDWSSDMPVSNVLQKAMIYDKRIRVIRVEGEPLWILSCAYNLGFRMSSYDTILKIDADIEIKENFFVSNKLGKEEYLAGNWRNRPLDQVQANDFFFIKRKHLSQVNGFNEFITTIGWNYEDLYDRLNTLGLCRKDFTSELVHYYIPDGSRQPICKKEHCGKLRSALEHALINPNFFIQKNRIICEKIKTWSRESRLAQFHQIKSQGNAPVFRRAPAFRNSIPRALSCVAETEALKIVVHNLWGLNFWNENDAQVRRLLYKYSKLN